jgi:hypothetical protein
MGVRVGLRMGKGQKQGKKGKAQEIGEWEGGQLPDQDHMIFPPEDKKSE